MKSNTIIFSILCLIWGMTWIGIKAGIAVVPPLMFAGTRFAVAGILILGIACLRGKLPRVARRDWPRLLLVTLLMIPLCYGPLFWGMLYIDSGTAAVLELSLTPVALLVFALLLGDERYDGGRLFAILLGVIGLCILFAPEVYSGWAAPNSHSTSLDVLGSVAVAAAAIIYAWGSVMARPLLAIYSSDFVAGSTTVLGGTALVLASLAFEPGSSAALAGNWGWPAWAGWAFLVLFGSVVGYTLFMRLLRDIGASRAGAFAFVSPVVAVLLGIVVYGEEVGFIEMIGMAVMLSAAFLALRGPKDSKSPQALSVITAHSRDWL